MKISAVAFDLDDTLAESKSPMSPQMAELVIELASRVPVCIISGGRFEQFDTQVLRFLPDDASVLDNVHLMPTCGTRYLRHRDGGWAEIYAKNLPEDLKQSAIEALERSSRDLGLWEGEVWGDRIEDRGSQVTFSALGQQAPVAQKKLWDPDGSRREALRERVQAAVPELEVRAGGSTSIDVTAKGIDKAHGIRALAEILQVPFEEILFVGDRLQPGGNDYPVIALGVQVHEVADATDTLAYVPTLLAQLAGPVS